MNNLITQKLSQSLIPNPTNSLVKVNLNGYDYAAEKLIWLMDATGRIVLQKTFTSNQFDLNLQGFNNGIYIVKIISDKGVSESKLIKQ